MGATKDIGKSPNLIWKLCNMDGHAFENWIFNMLTRMMEKYLENGTKIKQTPGSGDNGKDIVIHSMINLENIFCQNFRLLGKDEMTIYLECKSTNKTNVPFNKIIDNVIRTKYDTIDYFVLITNATIIPDTYYKIYKELDRENVNFVLIDQFILAKCIHEMGIENVDSIPLAVDYTDFCGQYQVLQSEEEGKTVFEVPILLRNYLNKNQNVNIRLLTDGSWDMFGKTTSSIIPPFGSAIMKFFFKQVSYNGIEELNLFLKNQNDEKLIKIQGINYKEVFIPSFIGESREQLVYEIKEIITSSKQLRILYVWGESGIGKSRTVKEVFDLVREGKYDLKTIYLSAKCKDPTSQIKEFLLEKGYMKNNSGNSLYDYIKQSTANSYRNAVILLEDFHYADEKVIEQIKLLDNIAVPVCFIVCGRSDYTDGKLSYYSFIQWTLENRKENSWELSPLLPDETKRLIKSMVNSIPNEALDTIQKRSMNNPLYIVQYIEYLLDINIVELQNRNTVGVLNPDTFPVKDDIPKKISSIYKKRIRHLINTFGENEYLNVLLILTIYNGEVSVYLLHDYLNTDEEIIEELLRRRYIKYGENKTIQFVHESLLMFFKDFLEKKKNYQSLIAKQIIEGQEIFFHSLPDYEIGKLYIWHRKRKLAKKYFQCGVNEISNISNYSNINIDSNLYEYLFDIFGLYKNTDFEISKNALISRIYLSLHHYAPMKAVYDCEKSLSLINALPSTNIDRSVINIINSLKAHALLNAGHLEDGEFVLKELLSEFLIAPEKLDKQSLFDIVDRLAAVSIKYNTYKLAQNYVKWEIRIAEQFQKEFNDNSLLVIAHRTRSKLMFFQDPKECQKSLVLVNELQKKDSSMRIHYSNLLSEYIYDMYYSDNCNWAVINERVEEIHTKATEHSYDRVLVRSDMVLSVCALKLAKNYSELMYSKKIVENGIDASIRLGIPGYIWQFYNLLAIICTRLGYEDNYIHQLFETIYVQLAKQNLLYIGTQQLCFCNLLAISNIGAFLKKYTTERYFREKMLGIKYVGASSECNYNCASSQCNYVCPIDSTYINKQYELAEKKALLWVKEMPICKENINNNLLRDDETQYFIPIS